MLRSMAIQNRKDSEQLPQVDNRRGPSCRSTSPPPLPAPASIPRPDGRALQDAIKDAVGERRSYLGDLYVDDAGRCVELLYPEREEFHGLTLEIALAWCLVYLMTDELGIGEFAS